MREYVANLHVHSTYSDGTGNIEEIIAAAERAGIDIVGLTDHHTLQAYRDGYEGWHEDVLLVVGMENNKENNHYLSWGIEREVEDATEKPQKVIDSVAEQEGVGFIAHPVEFGSPLLRGKNSFPWIDWSVTNYTGICIWNYSSQFRDGAVTLPGAVYQAFFNPHQRITGPHKETLSRWDEACQNRRVVAIGGSDAHAFPFRVGVFRKILFPYEFLFRCVNTHLLYDKPLSRDSATARKQFCCALKEGSCFVAFDYYRSAKGFRFWGEHRGKEIRMGRENSYRPNTILKASLPQKGLIKLFRNGKQCYQVKSRNMEFSVKEPGVYRLEVFHRHGLGWRPWIFSNPIYLR